MCDSFSLELILSPTPLLLSVSVSVSAHNPRRHFFFYFAPSLHHPRPGHSTFSCFSSSSCHSPCTLTMINSNLNNSTKWKMSFIHHNGFICILSYLTFGNIDITHKTTNNNNHPISCIIAKYNYDEITHLDGRFFATFNQI